MVMLSNVFDIKPILCVIQLTSKKSNRELICQGCIRPRECFHWNWRLIIIKTVDVSSRFFTVLLVETEKSQNGYCCYEIWFIFPLSNEHTFWTELLLFGTSSGSMLNSLTPERCGCRFWNITFELISWIDTLSATSKIVVRWMLQNFTGNGLVP